MAGTTVWFLPSWVILIILFYDHQRYKVDLDRAAWTQLLLYIHVPVHIENAPLHLLAEKFIVLCVAQEVGALLY
jgi:hypothetical protein